MTEATEKDAREEAAAIRRKLAAIMFTDIFQYSRLMSRDEGKAIRMLADHDEITGRVVAAHEGRILKRMGDALFAEFASSVAALQCAIGIQAALGEYNRNKGPEERILVRIGLHEGDVMVRGDDLFGEGVNVAARLEPLADPGGICLSEALYRSVRNATRVEALKVGDVSLKNILQRYTVYKIPSPYGDTLPETAPAAGPPEGGYRIRQVVDLPVRFLSPVELAGAALVLYALCLVSLLYATTGAVALDALLVLLQAHPVAVPLLAVLLVLLAVHFYATKSVRVVFDDIREVDRLLDELASQIGYTRHLKDRNRVILKPSLYHVVLYSARRILADFDGNAVVLTGNTMYIRKLVRVLRSFQRPG